MLHVLVMDFRACSRDLGVALKTANSLSASAMAAFSNSTSLSKDVFIFWARANTLAAYFLLTFCRQGSALLLPFPSEAGIGLPFPRGAGMGLHFIKVQRTAYCKGRIPKKKMIVIPFFPPTLGEKGMFITQRFVDCGGI